MTDTNDFIEKIIKSSLESKLIWKPVYDEFFYNNNKESIESFSKDYNQNRSQFEEIHFNLDDSFYCKYKNSIFYLFKGVIPKQALMAATAVFSPTRYFVFAIQSVINERIVHQNEINTLQAELMRLYNIIIRQINNVLNVIDDFMNDKDI